MPKSANTADEYDFVDHHDTVLDPEVVAQLREWLHPTDYLAESGEFRRHLLSQAPGTGLWICQTEEYRKWHDSPDHGSLWIKGAPGAGKSVMAASLIQHLRVTENCPVLFFFFRNIVAANFSPRALIQDWLAQLLPYSPKLQFALQPRRLTSSLEETSDGELIQLFLDGVSCVPKLYCVGDALDEMSTDNKPFLDKLNSLATHRPRTLKLLMTSRPKQYLQSTLRDSSIVHVSLQQRLVDADILAYLNHRFDILQNSESQRQLKQDVIDMVAQKSEGLFLYAKLTMDQLEESLQSDTTIDIAALETSLPIGLEQTYTRMLAKQRCESEITTYVQLTVLEAVTHASRPLRLNELAGLLECVYPNLAQPNIFKALIASSCGPLVEIREDETLQVIHHSFTEFLRGENRSPLTAEASSFPIIDSLQAHRNMAINCLRYLQAGSMLLDVEKSGAVPLDPAITFTPPRDAFELYESSRRVPHWTNIKQSDPFDYRSARLLHPFLSYAVDNWPYHASFYDVVDDDFFQSITSFVNPQSLPFLRWLVIKWGATSTKKGSTDGIPTPLHLASFAGLTEFALELLRRNASVSALDAQKRTPLHWAAANGHANVASLLMRHGANPDADDRRGLRSIHLAVLRDRVEVIKLLLKAGVSPDTSKTKEDRPGYRCGAKRTKGESALTYASRAGCVDTVLALAPFCDENMLGEMLCLLCSWSRTEATLALLDNSPVSPNATYRNATALYYACSAPNSKCAERLIIRGADVNKVSRMYNAGQGSYEIDMAPIHRLVKEWNDSNDAECQNILEALLKAGADIDQLNGEGQTALLQAASYSKGSYNCSGYCFPSVKALVEEGANVKAVNPTLSHCVITRDPELCSSSVLHSVARKSRDLEIMKLLLERGCDLNEKSAKGQTVLLCAVDPTMRNQRVESESKTRAIVEYLLDQGANPSCQDDDGNSPLSYAMLLGASIFRLLFSKCQDMVEKKRCWFSLCKLRRRDTDKFSQCLGMFLSEGFDIETRDEDGKTLFLHCCIRGPRERMEILLSHGANPNAKTSEGHNALLLSCLSPSKDCEGLRQLITAGVSPLETNNDGNTVLHLIAECHNMKQELAEFVCHLIDSGVPVNATNNNGSTPLHLHQEKDCRYYDRHNRKRYHFIDVLNSSHGVDFGALDNDGLSAFHIAATKSEAEVARFIDYGVDINLRTSDSRNALHVACEARKPNIIGQLLMRGIDFDQQDDFGRTPLHYACRSGDAESVEWLLRHGASPHLKASDGSTLLHACANVVCEEGEWDTRGQRPPRLSAPPSKRLQQGRYPHIPRPWYRRKSNSPPPMAVKSNFPPAIPGIVESLIQAGVEVGCCDENGTTALDVALFTGCTGFIEVFYRSESLLEEATKNLETIDHGSESVDTLRQRIRLQISLMLPRPYLEFLDAGDPTFEMLLESPGISLGLLSTSDTIVLINKSFEKNPTSWQMYTLLNQLMEPDSIQMIDCLKIIENTPKFISYYSKYEGMKARFEAIKSQPAFSGDPPKTALGIACSSRESNLLTVRTLVEKLQVDVNARLASFPADTHTPSRDIVPGGTALHILASAEGYWQLEALKYLLAHGADVNAIDERGDTPLHIASMRWQSGIEGLWKLEAVKILLDHGADVNILDDEGLSVLHKASSAPGVVEELLSRGMDANIGVKSPLFACIRDQNLETLELLLKYGAKPDAIDEKCHSKDVNMALKRARSVCPLLFSAFPLSNNIGVLNDLADSVPLLVALIKHGADLYLPLNDDETLIHLLFEYTEYDVIEALMEEPCVSRIDFNRRDQRGRTILMAACSWQRDLLSYSTKPRRLSPRKGPPLKILSHRADASLVDSSGKTALHHLLGNPGYPDDVLIEFINQEEVSPTLFQKDGEGYSPLHHALGTIRPAVCEALLTKGADLLEPDPQGRTALHYIASQCLLQERKHVDPWRWYHDLKDDFFDGCLSLWQKYLSHGGSINAADNAGDTPLHAYLSMLDPCGEGKRGVCHVDHYEALFSEDSGVDVFAVNKAGETALHRIASRPHSGYLVEGHDKALFVMMMEKGLDPLKEDMKGRSALDVASACDKEDIVGLLGRK